MSKKFEQLLEYVVNDEMDKANALFHDIVVAKSREIYENLITDELDEEMIGGSPTSELIGEIEEEEDSYGLGEEEMMDDEESDMVDGDEESDMGDEESDMVDGDDDMSEPLDMDGEEDMGDEEDAGDSDVDHLEDELTKAQDMLASLQQEFEKIAAKGARDEHAEELPADDMGHDEEMDENAIFEYKEHAPKPKTSEESGTNTTSPLAKNAKSPTGVGKPVAVRDGAQGNHGVKPPGKLTTATTAGEGTKMKKVQDMKNI